MIHQQLAAAWTGIEPQDIAFLRENADLRIVIYYQALYKATVSSRNRKARNWGEEKPLGQNGVLT